VNNQRRGETSHWGVSWGKWGDDSVKKVEGDGGEGGKGPSGGEANVGEGVKRSPSRGIRLEIPGPFMRKELGEGGT